MELKEFLVRGAMLKKLLPEWVDQAFKDNIAEMHDMNVAQMEERGIEATGDQINRGGDTEYDEDYAEYKSMLGGETRFINLNLDGNFHSALTVKVDKRYIEFNVDHSKADAGNKGKTATLIKWYGMNIFGLTDENVDELVDNVVWFLKNKLAQHFADTK